MKIYLKIIALFYGLGAALHLLDIFDLRLPYSELAVYWKVWIVYLLIGDTIAAMGCWKQKAWGEVAFMGIATSQIIAYVGFKSYFGNQDFLVIFHVTSLISYGFLKVKVLKKN